MTLEKILETMKDIKNNKEDMIRLAKEIIALLENKTDPKTQIQKHLDTNIDILVEYNKYHKNKTELLDKLQ